jgi:hypothetical protein
VLSFATNSAMQKNCIPEDYMPVQERPAEAVMVAMLFEEYNFTLSVHVSELLLFPSEVPPK